MRKLITEFRQLILDSGLQEGVQKKLLSELATYARTFEPYAESALRAGNVAGGKGPFRDAAHRIEATLHSHHVPNLETNILKLRRWEKDFLLRGDLAYPQKVLEVARTIRAQIEESALSDADKVLLVELLRDYQQGFLALVEQRARILVLTRAMDAAANQVVPLIKANVDQANQLMATRVDEISESSQASVRLGLLVLIGATACPSSSWWFSPPASFAVCARWPGCSMILPTAGPPRTSRQYPEDVTRSTAWRSR